MGEFDYDIDVARSKQLYAEIERQSKMSTRLYKTINDVKIANKPSYSSIVSPDRAPIKLDNVNNVNTCEIYSRRRRSNTHNTNPQRLSNDQQTVTDNSNGIDIEYNTVNTGIDVNTQLRRT